MKDNSTLVSFVEQLNRNNNIVIQSYNPPIPCLFTYFTEKQILEFIKKHHDTIKKEDLYTHTQSSNNVLSIAHEHGHLKAFVTAFNLFNIDTKNINIIKDKLTEIMQRKDIIKLMTTKTKDAFLSLKDDKGNTPLHIAFSQGDFKTIELLTSGLTIEQIGNRLTQKNADELTPFNLAVKNFKFDQVKKILPRFDFKQQAAIMDKTIYTAVTNQPHNKKPNNFEKNKTKTFKEVFQHSKLIEKSINSKTFHDQSEYGKLMYNELIFIADKNHYVERYGERFFLHDFLLNTNLDICYEIFKDALQSTKNDSMESKKVNANYLFEFFNARYDYRSHPEIEEYCEKALKDTDYTTYTTFSFMDRVCIEASRHNDPELPLKFIKLFELTDEGKYLTEQATHNAAQTCNNIKYRFEEDKKLHQCNKKIIKYFNTYLIDLCRIQDSDGNTLLHDYNFNISRKLKLDFKLPKDILNIQNTKGKTVLHTIFDEYFYGCNTRFKNDKPLQSECEENIKKSIKFLFKGLSPKDKFTLLMIPDNLGNYCFNKDKIPHEILQVLFEGQNQNNICKLLQTKNRGGYSLFELGSMNVTSEIFKGLSRKQKIQVFSALDGTKTPSIELAWASLTTSDYNKAAEALIDISYDLLIQHKDHIINQHSLPVWAEWLYESMDKKDKTKFLKALKLDSTKLELSLPNIKTLMTGIDVTFKCKILKNNLNFVTQAIQKNYSVTLETLLEDINRKLIYQLLKENPGWVSTAADKNNERILRILLDGISEENKSQLLKTHLDCVSTAIKNSNLDILKALFKDINPAIKTSLLKDNPDWISTAIKNSNLDVLKELFKDIDVQDKYKLIDKNPDWVTYILHNDRTADKEFFTRRNKLTDFLLEDIDEDEIEVLLKNHPDWLEEAIQHNPNIFFYFFIDYIDGKESMRLIPLLNKFYHDRNNGQTYDYKNNIPKFEKLMNGLIDNMSDKDKLTFITENTDLIIEEIKSNSILKSRLFEEISDENTIHILNNDDVLKAAMEGNGDFIIRRFLRSISTQEDNILHKDNIQELLKKIIDKYPNIRFSLRHLNTDQTVRLLKAYHGFSSDTSVLKKAIELDLHDAFKSALPKRGVLSIILNRRDVLKLCLANDKKPFLSVLLKEIKTEAKDIPIIMKKLEKYIQKQLKANKKPNDSSNNSTDQWAQSILSKVTSVFQTDKVEIPSKLLTQIIDLALIEVLIPLPEKSALQAITTYQEYFTQDHIDDLDLLLTKLNDLPTHSDKQVSNTKSLFDKVASAFQHDPIVNAKNTIDSIKTRLSPGKSNKLGK